MKLAPPLLVLLAVQALLSADAFRPGPAAAAGVSAGHTRARALSPASPKLSRGRRAAVVHATLMEDAEDTDTEAASGGHDGDEHDEERKAGAKFMSVEKFIAEVSKIIKDYNPATESRLNMYVESCKGRLGPGHVAFLLQKCSQHRIRTDRVVDVDFILSGLKSLPKKQRSLTAMQLAAAMDGLRSLDPSNPRLDELLSLLVQNIRRCKDPLKSCNVGQAMYGFQRFDSNNDAALELLREFTKKMKSQKVSLWLDASDTSKALFGLRQMSNNRVEVQECVDVLAEMIENNPAKGTYLTKQADIAPALNGLQRMTCTRDESAVGRILAVLMDNIDNLSASETFSKATIGASANGLRRMKPSTPVVRRALLSLAMKIRTSESALSADTAAGVLDGVCAMSDDHPEVRAVIAAVSLKLRRSGSTLSPTDVKELLLPMRYSAGIYPERQELLETIFNMVEKKPSADQLVQENLAVGMYGLQEMNADRNPAVAKAYAVMGNWTLQAIKHTPTFALDGKHTGMMLHSLKKQRSANKVPEVRQMLGAIAKAIAASTEPISEQHLTMAFKGLGGMRSDFAEVTAVLYALKPRMVSLDTMALANVLFSMRQMCSSYPAVREMAAHVAELMEGGLERRIGDGKDGKSGRQSAVRKLENLRASDLLDLVKTDQDKWQPRKGKKQAMTALELCIAYTGLAGMNSKHVEVLKLLSALNREFERSLTAGCGVFEAHLVANAIAGFQSMAHEDSPEVALALGLWADRLDECKSVLTPPQLANVLYGMQGMSSNCPEVRAILQALLPKLSESSEPYSKRDMGMSLVGLSTMRPLVGVHEEVQQVIGELNMKLASTPFGGDPNVRFVQKGKSIHLRTGEQREFEGTSRPKGNRRGRSSQRKTSNRVEPAGSPEAGAGEKKWKIVF